MHTLIVIVAVILYSMGIFNPSSSVTFTSSGFSPFTISSVICSQDGLSFSILAGPVPNGAYSMSIDKFYIVSSSGTNTSKISYALPSSITLTSGKTGIVTVPNVICPSSGTKVSISANIQYSYSTTAGKVVTNTTGTLAGTATHGPTLPSGIEYYSQLTISNSQSSATPSPFQQMVNITSSDPGFSLISTGNFGQNVEFFYSNGTVIPSWLESYSSTNAIWWLKLGSIPASSSVTVYMGIAPTSTNLFNSVNDGEAPQLTCSNPSDTASCSTYAEYDDGAKVFNNYWNFAGTIAPNGFTYLYGSGAAYNNGVTLSATTDIYYSFTTYNPSNYILEGYTPTTPSAAWGGLLYTTTTTEGGNYGLDTGYAAGESGVQQIYSANDGSEIFVNGVSINYPNIFEVYWASTDTATEYTNYKNPLQASTTDAPTITNSYIGLGAWGAGSITFNWMRVRAYPPNGVMPSVSFGSVA